MAIRVSHTLSDRDPWNMTPSIENYGNFVTVHESLLGIRSCLVRSQRQLRQPQLSARRIDVGAEFLADGRIDPLLHQAIPKGPNLGLGAPLIGLFFDRIIGNEVHVSEGSADEFSQGIGIIKAVVDAF